MGYKGEYAVSKMVMEESRGMMVGGFFLSSPSFLFQVNRREKLPEQRQANLCLILVGPSLTVD